MSNKRIIAEFTPQEWVNDYAINVDPDGPTTWDVTDYLLANYSREQIMAMRDDQYETDDLLADPNAPEWAREWEGPFYVSVSESIGEYFDQEGVTITV